MQRSSPSTDVQETRSAARLRYDGELVGLLLTPLPQRTGPSQGTALSGSLFCVRFSTPTWDGLVVDLVRVLFRVVKSQADGREIDDFMTVPRSRPMRREARPVA